MRQPRTLSERLELLNRLNRRQLELAAAEEDEESEDEAVLGAEEDDSGSELDDNLDDSDDNGSVSGSDSEGDFSDEGEEEDSEDEEEEEEGEEEGAVLPTAAGTTAPGVGQPVASDAPKVSGAPQASAEPDQPAGSMSIINPAPTGVANNPIVPSSSAAGDAELSTTAEVVSEITSAAGEATPTPSNSLAQAENESTQTASGADTSATSEEANNAGESSAQALGRGQQAGIVFGAIAGLGLMMSVGFVLFKWRKRRKASVYDRPPPPGIYREGEKGDAEVAVAQVPEDEPAGQGRGGMFHMVNSWIQSTPNRHSKGADVAPPQPVFFAPERNRETLNSATTGSDRKWG